MSSPPLFTTLNIPTVTSYPSTQCLQWSPDGQVCFTTKTAAYIMTPDHGINLDLVSTIKSTPTNGAHAVAWFRTIIPFDKADAQKWPEHSQAWGSTSLGSIDVALWSIAFSPSGLSPDAGCVLVALTSNMDLTLWTGSKNSLKGEWIKVLDVTPFLLELFSSDEITSRVLKAQITSISWSQQPNFGLQPLPAVDASLLVIGSRAGSLTLLRYLPNKSALHHLETISVSDKWITHITVSPWTSILPGSCEAYLGYATSDGVVGLLRISQTLSVAEGSIRPNITFTVDKNAAIVCQPDKAGITALTWKEIRDKLDLLVYCKPGVLHLWRPPSPTSSWSGHRALRLQSIKLSAGSSLFQPSSGILYIPRLDILILSLFDGSLHVVCNVSRDPSLTALGDDRPLTSKSLSLAVRNVFIQTEQDVEFLDANRMPGLASYDGLGTLIWVQESARPSDFSYKHDAKHNSTLLVSSAWNCVDDDLLLHDLARVVHGSQAVGFSPLYILRPFLFWLRDKRRLELLHNSFLDVLKAPVDDHTAHVAVPGFAVSTPETRSAFRTSLSQHLFGWDVLSSLRLRFLLADFACRRAERDDLRDECATVAQNLLMTISHRILRTVIRHLIAVVDILTPNDVPFVLRMIVQSLLEGSPSDLMVEGHHLSRITQAKLFNGQAEGSMEGNTFNERCPACRLEVPLLDIGTAVCANGHTWARCSITTFILSTPLVRTCISCGRKAFLPLSAMPDGQEGSWLPVGVKGWVVEELLEAVRRCLFCNNSFINVL